MATQNNDRNRLQELSGSNFEIADGQPDIRNWEVKDESGKKLGKVKELIFDETSLKVRYIVLDFKGNDFDLENRKVLVPIGIATLHESDDDVILPGVGVTQLKALPDYDEDNLTGDSESNVRNVFAGVGAAALAGSTTGSHDDDFYNHDHFNEDNLYRNRVKDTDAAETIPVIQEELQVGKREVEKGRVRLRARIIENQVSEDISLKEEKVNVTNTQVNRPATASDYQESEIEITEKAEVPVVSKEARVVEEVSLHKDVNEKEVTINDTVRNTEVEVERADDEHLRNKSGTL